MTTSILTVRLNNDDKITFANMCKDLGVNYPPPKGSGLVTAQS